MDIETGSEQLKDCSVSRGRVLAQTNPDLPFLVQSASPQLLLHASHSLPELLDFRLFTWMLCSYGSFWTSSLNSTNVWGTGLDDADNTETELTYFVPS